MARKRSGCGPSPGCSASPYGESLIPMGACSESAGRERPRSSPAEPQLVEPGLHRVQVPDAQAAIGEPDGQPALIGAPGVRPDGATLLAQAEGQLPSPQVPEGDARGGRLPGEPVTPGANRRDAARERAVVPQGEHPRPLGQIPGLADAPGSHEG